MKKLYTYTRLLFMALTAVTLMTSCDKDTELAYDLEGVWQGSVTGNYYYDRYGVSSNDYDTEIMFKQDAFSSGGSGYEIDHRVGSRSITKTYFDWKVRDGRIYLNYDDGYRVIIRDYETYWMGGSQRFRGYFDDYETGEQMAAFNLIKVASQRDYYEYRDWDTYYWTRSGQPADSVKTE